MDTESGQGHRDEQKEVHAVTMPAFGSLIKVGLADLAKLDKSIALW